MYRKQFEEGKQCNAAKKWNSGKNRNSQRKNIVRSILCEELRAKNQLI